MPNEKLPRKVNCKLIDGMEYRQNIMFDNQKQIDFNNKFIEFDGDTNITFLIFVPFTEFFTLSDINTTFQNYISSKKLKGSDWEL